MDDELLLEKGLEAFEKMNEELAKHQQLFSAFEKVQRQFYHDTSRLAKEATQAAQRAEKASQEALRASQKAVEASKIELRSNLIWLGFIALLIVSIATFAGYQIGHRGWF